MSRAWYRFILKLGVYASLVSLFLVNRNFYFPYITTKQIYFNLLIEVLLVLVVAFWWKYPSDRPKRSWITIGLIIYLVVVLLSCFSGVDFNLSFWGNLERMLGWFSLAHFLGLYLIIITVFRSWRDWQPLLMTVVSAGTLLSIIGLFQNYGASSLGNAAYMGTLMLMAIFIAGFLMARSRSWLLALPYGLVIIVLLIGLVHADISGAFAGLAAGLLVTIGLFTFLNKNKTTRRVGWIGLTVLIVGVGGLFLARSSSVFDNTRLGVIMRDFSLENNTLNTRFYAWQWAWQDLPNQPVLGVGHGNFSAVFNRQFKSDFYKYSKNEEYFDRAHNNIVEITSTTGLLGLIAYLFLFSWVVIYLIQAYRKKQLTLLEFSAWSGFLVAYFVQNLALFDCLASYLVLMIAWAFIHNLGQSVPKSVETNRSIGPEIGLWLGVGLVMAWVAWYANISTIKMAQATIGGIINLNQEEAMAGLASFKEMQATNSPLIRDGRSAMINHITANLSMFDKLSNHQTTQVINYAIDQVKKNLAYNPEDSFTNLQLAQLLIVAGQVSQDNLSVQYWREGLEAADQAIKYGSEHVRPYYAKAQLLVMLDQLDQATEVLKEALAFSDYYWDTYCHLARFQINQGINLEEAYGYLDHCLDSGGINLMGVGDYLNQAILHYQEKGDLDRLVLLMENLAFSYPDGAEIWFKLADLYYQQGRLEEAHFAAQQAISLQPDYKEPLDRLFDEL